MPTRPFPAADYNVYVGRFKLDRNEGVAFNNFIKICHVCKTSFWYSDGYTVFEWSPLYLIGDGGKDRGCYTYSEPLCSPNCFDLYCLSKI